jgi:hypothetical protein
MGRPGGLFAPPISIRNKPWSITLKSKLVLHVPGVAAACVWFRGEVVLVPDFLHPVLNLPIAEAAQNPAAPLSILRLVIFT